MFRVEALSIADLQGLRLLFLAAYMLELLAHLAEH
jgi:hypothetical protein